MHKYLHCEGLRPATPHSYSPKLETNMSSDSNPVQGNSAKYSYPRKVVELGRTHINTSTFGKIVEVEPAPNVKTKGLSDVEEYVVRSSSSQI